MERMLYTVEEVARSLGLGRTKVYELIKSEQLTSVRIGQARRIPADAVTAFLSTLRSDEARTAAIRSIGPTSEKLSRSGETMASLPHVEEAS